MQKFKVGDRVRIADGTSVHTVVEYCTDGEFKDSYLLSNGLHYGEEILTIDASSANSNKEKAVEMEKINVGKIIEDIRVGSKVITIPQKNAASVRFECDTVVVTVNGKDYEAVCMPGDEFNLERGIEVAIFKAALGGTKEYNKYIRDAVKLYKACEKARKIEEEENKRLAAKRDKEISRKKARRERIAKEERQARINEMSEAFLKAMRDYDSIGMDSMIDEETARCIDINVENARIEEMCNAFLRSKGLIAVPTDDLK